MTIDVVEESVASLADYARVSIAFEVREIVDVSRTPGGAGFTLRTRPVDSPWIKDYDADGGPLAWPARFDLSQWALFAARVDGVRVGGAAVVLDAGDVGMREGQRDTSLLWDIRVDPGFRGRGVGRALVEHVERWSVARGARWLEVETQNINAPACRFYERRGFVLREVNADVYPFLPNELQLLWYKRLAVPGSPR